MIIKKWSGSTWVTQYPDVDVNAIVATGTPGSTNYLRGDGAWVNPHNAGVTSITGNTTLTTSHANSILVCGGLTSGTTSAYTLTLNYNVFDVGAQITIVSNTTGLITIATGTYVYINWDAGDQTLTTGKWNAVTLMKIYDTATTENWVLVGAF